MNKLTTILIALTVMLLFVPVVSATMKINISDFYTTNPLASYNVLVSTEDNRSLPYNNADNQTLWLEFDANNQTAPDSSGNGNTGTLNGYSFNNLQLYGSPQPFLNASGKYGSAYTFNSVNGNYLNNFPKEPTSTNSKLSNGYTLATWVNIQNLPSITDTSEKYFFGIQNLSASFPYTYLLLRNQSGSTSLRFRLQTNGTNCDASISHIITTANTSEWIYVTGTYNSSSQRLNLFINGNYVTQSGQFSSDCTTLFTNIDNSVKQIWVGGNSGSTGKSNATIDESRFWNRTLSNAEILQEMNSPFPVNGNGLVASYSFESNFTNATGNYTYDTNNLVAGQINGSFRFDGINTVVSNATSSVTLTTSGTINYWIKWNKKTTGSNSRPIDKSGNYYMEIIEASNRVDCSFQGLSDNYLVGTGTALTENTWTMISCVYNGTNVSIYKNGVFIIGEPSTGTITSTASTFRIGSEGGTRWYNGSIDDVRIYNTSLSQSQITALYNAGAYRIYNYTSSNGNGTINLPLTNTGLVNMSLTSTANGGYYQSWAINHNTNLDYINTMYQSTNTFSATQKVTGLTATASFVTQYLTNSTHYMYVQPYQVNLSNGWYGAFNYTPTALATGSYAYTGAYNWLTNVSASLIPDIAGQDVTFRFGNTPYTFSESVTTNTNSNIGLVDTVLYNLSINATYPTGSVSIYIPNHNISQGIAIQ